MRLSRGRLIALIALIPVLLLLSQTQQSIFRTREAGNYRGATIPVERLAELPVQDLGIVTIGAIMGGFRSIAANILWIKCDGYWHEGKAFRLVPLAKAVVLLEPHFIEAWRITAWHLAYNMSVESETNEQARDYINMGIRFLEEGIRFNPDRYELYFELAWTYYDKLNEFDKAAEVFAQALRRQDEFGQRPPTYLWRMVAHAYERYPKIDEALKWWYVDAQVEPDNPIHKGAIETIQERYVPAWEHFAQEDYYEAHAALVQHWQKDDPYDTIGLHLRARIYERQGDVDNAIQTWFEAARHSSVDKLARRRLMELCRATGRPLPDGISDVGLPIEITENWDEWFSKEFRSSRQNDLH